MPKFELPRAFRVSIPTVLGLMAAGCSADVARFETPAGFSSNQTSSIAIPPANVHSPSPRAGLLGDGDGAGHPAPNDVRVADLPPASSSYDRGYDAGGSGGYDVAPVRNYDAAPSRRSYQYDRPGFEGSSRSSRGSAGLEQVAVHDQSETIEVKPGDTLYGLSKRHGVSVSEIKSANTMSGDSLRPGQRLRVPSGRGGSTSARIETAAAASPSVLSDASPITSSADASGTYTMKAGDSLYAVARKHNVNYAELQSQNGITDARKVRPGTVLKLPGQGSPEPMPSAAAAPATASADTAPATPVAETETSAPATSEPPKQDTVKVEAPAVASPPDAPKVLNAQPASQDAPAAVAPVQVAEAKPEPIPTAQPAVDQSASKSSSGRLRWPVQGKIISPFGPRPDGTHNDGVNFSVPQGTDVHAAEAGEVIYVGDELKAYGKLVLLRHDNGWVTAYAHNEDLSVTRGQKVSRGDVIAKAGKTGPVDQPQVHFELRQDSKAVDPTSFMEKM